MKLLSLDLSTHTGWAFGSVGENPRYGVWELGSDGNHGRYFSSLANSLQNAFDVMKPDLVVFEAPLPPAAPKSIASSEKTVRVLIGLAAVTEMICHEWAIRCEEASCRDARQLVMGKQPVPAKEGVIAWCRMMGWPPQDDNAADALVLWEYRHLLEKKRCLIQKSRLSRT